MLVYHFRDEDYSIEIFLDEQTFRNKDPDIRSLFREIDFFDE